MTMTAAVRNAVVAASYPAAYTLYLEEDAAPSSRLDGAQDRLALATEVEARLRAANIEYGAKRASGSLHGWIDEHRAAIDSSPAAFCAMETAVVDLIGKVAGRTAEDVLGEARPTGEFRYTAVLGDSPWPVYRWQCRRYRADGFRDFKVKVSGDRRKMRALPDRRAASAHEGPRVRPVGTRAVAVVRTSSPRQCAPPPR